MHLNIAHVLLSMLVHVYTSLSFVSFCILLTYLAQCMYRTRQQCQNGAQIARAASAQIALASFPWETV